MSLINSFWRSDDPWIQDHKWVILGILILIPLIIYSLISKKISLSSGSPIFSKAERPYDYWLGISIYVGMFTALVICIFL